MRVIAGTLKGRRLSSPTWAGLRPTSDKLRGTLFNVLAPRIRGAKVLDGYAGSGAVGIEAISRGAGEVTFVESDARAQALIAGNLANCGVLSGYVIIRSTLARALATLGSAASFVPFDIILLDPPYDCTPSVALAGVDQVLAPDGMVVLEHARRTMVPERAGELKLVRELRSGDSALAFYTCQH